MAPVNNTSTRTIHVRTFKLTSMELPNVRQRETAISRRTQTRTPGVAPAASVWALRAAGHLDPAGTAHYLRLNRLDPWIVMNAADAACSATWRKASWLAPE